MRCRRLAGGLVGGALAACSAPDVFVCEQDSQCRSSDVEGVCQVAEGYCSFPDPTCSTGQRLGEHSGEVLPGACVGAEASASSTGAPLPEPDTASTTSPLTTGPLGPSSDGAPSSSGPALDGSSSSDGSAVCPEDWWDCSWAWRMPLEVLWEGPALTDVPVRVALGPARLDLGEAAVDGADLRFVTDDGTVLAHELEWLSPDDDMAEVWVRLPELAAGGRAWLYWGNPAAADAQNPRALWASDHAAVWHMGPTLDDATSQHPLDDLNTADATGRIARARSFDGTSSQLRPITDEGFLELFSGGGTVSAWIRPTGWGQGGFGRVIDNATNNTSELGWNLAVADVGELHPGSLRFAIDHQTARGTWESEANAVALNQWQHVAITYDSSDPSAGAALYVDGAPVSASVLSTPSGEPELVSTFPATIGALGTGDLRFFAGQIDELRLSSVRRSPEWIAAEALAGADALLAYGVPEPQP